MKSTVMGSIFFFAGVASFAAASLAQELRFENVTSTSFPALPIVRTPIQDAVFNDFNNDGFADLAIAAANHSVLLFSNQQDGTFIPVPGAFETGSQIAQLVAADFDNDGDVDLATLTAQGACRLFQNQGAYQFREISGSAGLRDSTSYRAFTVADFDNDGRLDLILLSTTGDAHLFRQDAPSHFQPAMPSAYLPAAAATHILAGDWDGDRDQDVIITRGPGQSNLIYENNGRAQFSERAHSWGIADYDYSALGSAVNDIDNDGRLDLLLLRENAPAFLCINLGGRFLTTNAFPTWPSSFVSSAVFADFDNDGGSDLLLAGEGGIQVCRRHTDHSFVDLETSSSAISGAITVTAIADFDRDGLLDVFAGGANGAMFLLKNISTPQRAWFSALLVGESNNRNGFGAQVSFWMNGKALRQSLHAASGYHGSVANRWMHAGLGESAQVDSIVITWPSGEIGRFYHKRAARYMVFREGESEAAVVANGQFMDISSSAGIGGIPEHGGHAILFADVNGDKREDMYVTHTNFAPGSHSDFLMLPEELFINNGNNTFSETAASAGVNDPGQSHGAVWVDIDNDGDFDLFNGQRGPSGNRLYRNNANGSFNEITELAGILPDDRRTIGVLGLDIENDGDLDLFSANWGLGNEMYVNDGAGNFTSEDRGVFDREPEDAGTMAATAADVDDDGDLDIFLSKRDDACRLYINDGAGNFSDQAPARGVAYNGASNGAVFFDMDRDADLDLLLAVSSYYGSSNGDLTKLRVYRNDGSGSFDDETEAQNIAFEGYTANTGDVDNDGDEDIYLAINFGMSSLWLNDGTGHFTKQIDTGLERNGVDARATTLGDIDNDGDLDVAITYIEEPTFLYRNDLNMPGSEVKNFLQIASQSPNGSAGGWGTKFYLYEAGHLDEQNFLRGYKQTSSAQGTLSGNSPVVHFGVDPNKNYDLRVRYLDGSSPALTNLRPGQRIDLDAVSDHTPPVISAVEAVSLAPTVGTVTWASNEPATSQVEYGATAALGSFTTLDNALVQSHSVVLEGLSGATAYFYRVISADAAGNSAGSDTASFVTASIDITPPVISNVQILEIQSTATRLGWSTEEPATSQIEYGKTTGYGSLTPETQDLVSAHEVRLTGLEANTFYHFRVHSRDAQGNGAVSNDFQFNTLSEPLLADDFNVVGLDLNKWMKGSHAGNQTVVQDGALHLKTSSNNASGWIHTAGKFSANNKIIQIKVIQPNNDGALGMSPTVTTSSVNGFFDESNWYRFYVYRDINSGPYKLYVQWNRNGAVDGLDLAAGVNFTGNFYLRIRTDETKVYFEYSLNNVTWSTGYSENFSLPGYTLDNLYAFELSAYDTPSKGEWLIDDFAINSTIPPPIDNTPPVVSQVASSNLTQNSATITWRTDEASDSQVEFGLTDAYGNASVLDELRTTSHAVVLPGLSPSTVYHYRVKSRDAAGNLAQSGDFQFTTLTPPATVALYGIHEINLTAANAGQNPYVDGPAVTVTFNGISGAAQGKTLTVKGFWEGGNSYRVRFAPTALGRWSWFSSSSDTGLDNKNGALTCSGTLPAPHISTSGHVRESGFFPYTFAHADSTPFFIMGDTQWSFGTEAITWPGEFQTYVDARAAQGFNYVHGVVYQTFPAGNDKNEGGQTFIANDVDRLNPGFWQAFDERIAYLNQKGIVAGLLLAWGDNAWQNFQNVAQVDRYVQYLVNRYSAYDVIWITAGEYEEAAPPGGHAHVGELIQAHDAYRHPTTTHTIDTSADDFASASWHTTIYQQLDDPGAITADRVYGKPVINSEFGYEGNQTAEEVRSAAWQIAMRGGFFVYGNRATYHHSANMTQENLYSSGAQFMSHLKRFWTNNGLYNIAWQRFTRFETLSNSRWLAGEPGAAYVVYVDSAEAFSINLSETNGVVNGQWYNTRTGEWGLTFSGAASAAFALTPPGDGFAAYLTITNDNVAPEISNVSANSITSSSANISWNTNEAADSQVEYGLTTSYGSQTQLNAALLTAHAVALSNLQANTTYHYRVKSRDAAGNLATSGDFTFTTLGFGPIFSDNFSADTLDLAKWVKGGGNNNQTRVTNNALELRSSAFTSGWVVTRQPYTVRHTIAAVKIVQPNDDGDLGISPTYTLSATNGIYNEANWYRFYIYREQPAGRYLLFVQWKKNGIEGGLEVTGNLNISGVVYLRLRMDATEIHFEASLDNLNWIDKYHEPFSLPGYTLDSQFYFELSAYRTSQKGMLVVDDFTITSNLDLAKPGETGPAANRAADPMPVSYALRNYPNPFNISTKVLFELPQRAEVIITVFDFNGRQVRELVHANFGAGRHEVIWSGKNEAGNLLSTGTYLVRMRYREANSNQAGQIVRRVLLLK